MRRRRNAFGVLVLLLGAAASPAPAEAGVAYTALRDGLWQVVYQESPTSAPKVVGGDLGADASAPALSPDGKRVAFEVAGQGILVCPVAAGACQTVKTGIGSAVRPAWDPKSGELVFVRYTASTSGEDSDILVTQNALQDIRPLVAHTGNQDEPDVSPDGRLLAYSSGLVISLRQSGVRVVRQLWVMDLASGVPTLLVPGTHQDVHPDWSPDGQWLAFASDRGGEFEIWVVRPDGSGLRQVTSGPGTKTWPAWSPDGRKILYTRSAEGKQGLWLVGADGSGAALFGAGTEELRDADWR
jgi:TolB protein